jgi:phosphatidylethanolamine-binding protein (PEBP) family uncharacterized protein
MTSRHGKTPQHAALLRIPPAWTAIALAVILLLLTGCGGSSTTTTTTAATSVAEPTVSTPTNTDASTASASSTPSTSTGTTTPAHTQTSAAPVVEKISLTSPVLTYNGAIPARYTCDGKDTPPPLHWTGIPPGTAELMLDIIKIKPENGALSFAWAVTGLSPTTTGIIEGKLPSGAIVGANSQGDAAYRLCPPKGTREEYVIALFALLHHHPAKTGFEPAELRLQAEHDANYQALYIFKYPRS